MFKYWRRGVRRKGIFEDIGNRNILHKDGMIDLKIEEEFFSFPIVIEKKKKKKNTKTKIQLGL